MVKFSVHLKRLRPPHLIVSKYNAWIREVLTAAALWWIGNRLPWHFEPKAVPMYQYLARSREYQRRKRGMAQRLGYDQANPLVYSRKLIQSLAGRPASSFRVLARATSSRQTVRVPIPLGHPMNPKHAGEVGRLNDPDLNAMKKVAIEKLRERVERFNTVEVLTIN